jgi:hypothetical protein
MQAVLLKSATAAADVTGHLPGGVVASLHAPVTSPVEPSGA